MKHSTIIKIWRFTFIVLLALFSQTGKSFALDVNDIRFGTHPDKIRMVIDITNTADFRSFVLDSPYRLVIDLPQFTWKAGKVKKPDSARITDIRQGFLSNKISRIVFDFDEPVLIQSAFLLPAQGKNGNRLVIDYKFTSPQNFSVHKETIHGTLNDDIISNEIKSASQSNIPIPPSLPDRSTKTKDDGEKPLIVIDPGHGGQDPGAQSKTKLREKDVVLALSKDLKQKLLDSGRYRVLLTRETDIYIRLKDRVKFARDHEADLFVSIHADSIHKPDVHGTSVYTISKKASDAQTAKLAEKENQSDLIAGVEFSVEDEQVAFILGDFLMNATMNQSKFFANTLVTKFRQNNVYTLQNPHRYAGFAVLKAPDIPSVLIEAGFMSNTKEATLLTQPAHRQKLVSSIFSGIDAYFEFVHTIEDE